MGESSSSSNNATPLANETQVGPALDLSLDCYGSDQISIGQMEGRILASSVEESIEKSKSHWSEVREFDCDNEVAEVNNVELFETLQRHPTWGGFFMSFSEGEGSLGTLVVGEKFAKGGQAELYDVQVEWLSESLRELNLRDKIDWVLKVFKKGTSLRHLQAQWPEGMLQFHAQMLGRGELGLPPLQRFTSNVLGATLLKDGRFAFLMVKEEKDLKSLIDHQHSSPNNRGPFFRAWALQAMYLVALGVNQLHDCNIVHRDLKASNVLVSKKSFLTVVDYECSVGIVGTGFFRAPEILQACKDRIVSSKGELFTKAADVYSYGMICYEILTGKLLFEGHPLNDYDLVIKGARPELPPYVDGWICKLLNACWHSNLASRPSFQEILETLVANSSICYLRSLGIERLDLKWRILEDSNRSWMILEKWKRLRLKLRMQLIYWLWKVKLNKL